MNDIIDTFSNRLKKAMLMQNIKAAELSSITGVSKSSLSEYIKGKYEAKQDNVYLLAKALNVNEAWLMGADVPMERITKKDILGNPVIEIPILGTVKAGYDYLVQENWIGTIEVDAKLAEGNDLFALKVKGDSMFPNILEGDTVIVKKQDDFENGDLVVALVNGDEVTIKKGRKSETSILLQPFNNAYEPLIFSYEEMKTIPVSIIGVVKQLKRDY